MDVSPSLRSVCSLRLNPAGANLKAEKFQRRDDPGFGRSYREFWHGSHCRFRHERIQGGIFRLQRFTAEGFNVKADGRSDIAQRCVIRIALADDDALRESRLLLS